MGIINSDKECQICFRIFYNLEIHHINGNHKDDKKENLIEICKDCHTSIHKPIGTSKIGNYKNDSDKKVIENIYNLRLKLHKSKFGHTNFIPQDFITNEFIKNKKIEKFFEKMKKEWEPIKEIHIC